MVTDVEHAAAAVAALDGAARPHRHDSVFLDGDGTVRVDGVEIVQGQDGSAQQEQVSRLGPRSAAFFLLSLHGVVAAGRASYCQRRRNSCCAGISESIAMPSVASFTRAISWSMSPGRG